MLTGDGEPTEWPPIPTCNSPTVGELSGTFQADPYTGTGWPTRTVRTILDTTPGWNEVSVREEIFEFDPLERLADLARTTTEPGDAITRPFSFTVDDLLGEIVRTGPDGQETQLLYDDAYRPSLLIRSSITAWTTYYANGLVHTRQHGNGTITTYQYDDANRPTFIIHEGAGGAVIEILEYEWTADGLVQFITEMDDELNLTSLAFVYDNRNRLVEEWRILGTHEYNFIYEYDQAGNRTRKTDGFTGVTTDYVYDISDPELYGSQGNRLMYSVTYQDIPEDVIEERWYTYNIVGNANHVIRRIEGDVDEFGAQWYRGTRLFYAKNGHLWIARSERWQIETDPELGEYAINCEPLAAMEYRYDGGRQRYLVRPRDPVTLLPYDAADGHWSDYAGASIYGDYTLAGAPICVTDTMAHEPGLAQFDHAQSALHHLHGNLIGTTERMTDGMSAIAHRAVYTAFGEPVHADGPVNTRYGYAGAWGYEAAGQADLLVELGWLHVGKRYYDSASGRFMQRDPIGLRGSLNTYLYLDASPVDEVDPEGLGWITPGIHAESIKRNLAIQEKARKACYDAIASCCPSPAFLRWCMRNAREFGMPEFVDLAKDIIRAGEIAHGVGLAGGVLIQVLP